ncbi:hypothetical protein AXX02_08835 [Pseudomonas aeruginosa]|nr:hypothetical protein AXX02_08835 [Pseudomonas aeruginosa]
MLKCYLRQQKFRAAYGFPLVSYAITAANIRVNTGVCIFHRTLPIAGRARTTSVGIQVATADRIQRKTGTLLMA